jgi:hypothetical protein
VAPPLSPAEQERAARVARHWLVLLCAGAKLLPPDPGALTDPPQLEQIWRGIATANDMAEAELTVLVAEAFHLDVADLNECTPEAIAVVPDKIAVRLGILPLKVDGKVLTIAVSDPTSLDIEQQLEFVTKLTLHMVLASPADIHVAIEWHYRDAPP